METKCANRSVAWLAWPVSRPVGVGLPAAASRCGLSAVDAGSLCTATTASFNGRVSRTASRRARITLRMVNDRGSSDGGGGDRPGDGAHRPGNDDDRRGEDGADDNRPDDANNDDRSFHEIPHTNLDMRMLWRRMSQIANKLSGRGPTEDRTGGDDSTADKDEDKPEWDTANRSFDYSDLGVVASMMEGRGPFRHEIRNVFVLMFRSSGAADGIYSLRLGGVDLVLAFESEKEAKQYAAVLATQDFPAAYVEEVELSMVRQFCKQAGIRFGIVPSGSMVMPPTANEAGVDAFRSDRKSAADDPGAIPDRERVKELSTEEVNLMKARLNRIFGKGTDSDDSAKA
ncbi:hypothetical protein CDCA_CDCA02G0798 [Cyanidium caldarium]|uniref:Uncharacterized protein n=1 Tax=Cyanidium caldarium TaxID=2771 RepID=A0AAV9IRU9_CYACA|nr:hypothetical protein CDCA_CDCA02G0798 [Cyanidium caldarium]